MPNLAAVHLIELQAADGGWGPYPGSSSRTEATSLATLALGRSAEAGAAESAARGSRWLRDHRLRSGAWPLEPGFEVPNWATSLAVLALSYDSESADDAIAGARWLLAEKGAGPSWWVSLVLRFFPERRAVQLDAELEGWPWASGTFSWVEPTCYAMLALKRLRGGLDDDRLAGRLDHGDRMLVDRACPGGGWNYGNPRVLGEDLWAFPDTTAVGLLALADRGDLDEVAQALSIIPALLEGNDSILALALCAIAQGAHGVDRSAAMSRLAARMEGWDGGEIRALAWAAVALDERPDALGLADD